MNVLVGWIEAPGVADHAGEPRVPGLGEHRLGVGQTVGEGDLDLNRLPGVHTGDGLGGVHLGGCAEDDRIDVIAGQGLGEIGGGVADTVLGGHGQGRLKAAAHQGCHPDALDGLQPIQMLFTERPGPCNGEFHGCGSRTIWPTAVLLAGT